MSECSLLGWLNLAVLFLTGVVVGWYTIETSRLRREAQLQTELQNRPFVSLLLDEHRRVRLVNVGKGVATSLTVADVEITTERTYRLRLDLITHLGPGERLSLRWSTFQRAPEGDFVEMWGGEDFPHQLLANAGGQLQVAYQAIVGPRRYHTTLLIRQVTDEFPQPRITII